MPIIATDADLLRLRARVRSVRLGPDDRNYEFHLPDLDERTNNRFTILLTDSMNACGCSTGSLLMALCAAGSTAYYFLTGGTLAGATLQDGLLFIGWAAGGAVLGKVIGLAHARWKMLRIVRYALTRRPISHHPYQSLSQEEEPWEESVAKPRNG
jgi:hypothetical protein